MKFLITGGAGYIGSHIVDALMQAKGNEVVVLDDLSTGRKDNIAHHAGKKNFKFIKGDVCDAATARKAAAGCNVIVHEAAVVGVKHYVTDPLRVLHVNTKGTERMLEEARRNNAKLLFASTSEVYGRSTKLPLREDEERVLGTTAVDRWCYSTSKAFDEHLCFAYRKKYGLPVTILRYFNCYGPRALGNDYAGVVGIFMRRVLDGKPPLVHGDGRQTRCFTYISDTLAATLAAIERKEADGEIINIGSNKETTIMELAQMIVRASGKPGLAPKLIPYEDFYGKSYEDIRRRVPSIEKARRLLDWTPEIGLEKGLATTYAWYADAKNRGRSV
ncbi:MAG: NAD-dependent epimerase/dehydratase family protein [Candidatus Burarchaeum sp.]|nr:NAD-dependent epimerase/dehydratase family protein [Candidatus Burarchaeum sp.]MDO8340283.1 NAD-dependent epimerase/dehydratase family protein [Candidatus Burarchaeum sp.]